MAHTSLAENKDTPETESQPKKIVQIASKRGQERDTRGDLQKVGEVVGISEGDQNGNVLDTLRGPQLMRKIMEMVSRKDLNTEDGGRELIIDLARAQNTVQEDGLSEQDLSDEEVQALLDLRDTLKRTIDITLTLTGLKPDTERRLRSQGMEQKGTRMVTKSHTAQALKKPKATEAHVDQAA